MPLRYPSLWSALGWLLVAGVIVGSLLPAEYVDVVSVGDKLQHAGAYCAMTVWFVGLYRRSLYVAIGIGLLVLGVALDLLQGLTDTRSLDWHDMLANGFGVGVGLALAVAGLGGWCQRLEQRLLS